MGGTEKKETSEKESDQGTRTIRKGRGNSLNNLSGAPTMRNRRPGKESNNFPSCLTCFPLRLQTPECIKREQRLGEEGERKGNSARFVEKESIIIQLMWPFIDSQTKTLLILTLPLTIYTLVFPSAYTYTQKCCLCHLQSQPVRLDFLGTQTMGPVGCDHVQWRMHVQYIYPAAHTRYNSHTLTQRTHQLYNKAETWHLAHTLLGEQTMGTKDHGVRPGWKAYRLWRCLSFGLQEACKSPGLNYIRRWLLP